MTTAVTRTIVTARITTPDAPATPAASAAPVDSAPTPDVSATVDAPVDSAPRVYTVTVFMNTAPHSFDGYQPHHPLAEATLPDGSPLRLVFDASDHFDSLEAAGAAFYVGNRQGPDGHGQTWPADIRSVSVGDVIKVTGPDHWIIHLSVDLLGFTRVQEPTTLVGLTGTRATSRR
ncbi:hypothetical protein ACF1GY_35025 [Streptomyces sp. NPDC014684]|uniref:hypothetical protein n=1 Tax=Streptomyces sp. NPDC014684 TaxID=3364880 RepID=UPI0036FF165A